MIVANNTGGTAIFTMGGSDARRVTIPGGDDQPERRRGAARWRRRTARCACWPCSRCRSTAALDSDVVFHEYGHGLTWRMIGGMSGPIAGAIGEGASDGVAMLINGDDLIGEYADQLAVGIRRAPYAGYPLTYGDRQRRRRCTTTARSTPRSSGE